MAGGALFVLGIILGIFVSPWFFLLPAIQVVYTAWSET